MPIGVAVSPIYVAACGTTIARRRASQRRNIAALRALTLTELAWSCENTFTKELPPDYVDDNYVREVERAAFSRVKPTPVMEPRLLLYSEEVACGLLGLDQAQCEAELFTRVFAGNELLPGFDPFAAAYAGHQFGTFAGQLGDGRAITLGEAVPKRGGPRWELQLKGAGRTPYSQDFDGRAVMQSSVREFLASEAMHALGVPTTRALSLVSTGEQVVRQDTATSWVRTEPGAVVCRVAPSFIRFGHFQHFSYREEIDELRSLALHVLKRHFPSHWNSGLDFREKVAAMFRDVCISSARLVVEWQRVGFVHGVLNTDNMSICGLTLDYGAFGMLEEYRPDWTPNLADSARRRYAFDQQSKAVMWNLAKLGESLLPLLGISGSTEVSASLGEYRRFFFAAEADMQRRKLGLGDCPGCEEIVEDLWEELEDCMRRAKADYTIFFRRLAFLPSEQGVHDEALLHAIAPALTAVIDSTAQDKLAGCLRQLGAVWHACELDEAERRAKMLQCNPRLVPRNWMLQEASEMAEAGEPSMMSEMLEAFRYPYEETPAQHNSLSWEGPRPSGASSASVS